MVTIGYSKPYVALYDGSSGTDKYTEGMDLGAGVSYSDSIEVAEDNDFYANNVVDESDTGRFVSGDANITINGLQATAAKMILGIKNQTTVASDTEWDDYDDDTAPPDLGYGHVKMVREKGVDKFIAVVYPRIKFNMPAESIKTKEKEIDWQTQELTATIMRSLNGKHKWKCEVPTPFTTEEEAYAAVKDFLSQGGA